MGVKKIGGVAVVLAVAAATAWTAYWLFNRQGETPGALVLYGNIDIRQIHMAFQDPGRLLRLHVEEGDMVTQGQLVAETEAVRHDASVRIARGRMDAQKEVLARLLAGSRPEEIARERARVSAAEAVLTDAEQTFRRLQALARQEYVSQERLDNARAANERASAELDAVRQALQLAEKGPRAEDIAAARAQLEADRAALALAETALADTRLLAPARGVIQERVMEPGAMVFPQTPVVTLALTDPVWARAYVTEPDLGKVAPGMKASISTDSYPGKTYEGWVGFISPVAEFTPKQVETAELRSKLVYQARIYACNPENELRLGMPVTVTIPLGQPRREDGNQPRPCGSGPDPADGR